MSDYSNKFKIDVEPCVEDGIKGLYINRVDEGPAKKGMPKGIPEDVVITSVGGQLVPTVTALDLHTGTVIVKYRKPGPKNVDISTTIDLTPPASPPPSPLDPNAVFLKTLGLTVKEESGQVKIVSAVDPAAALSGRAAIAYVNDTHVTTLLALVTEIKKVHAEFVKLEDNNGKTHEVAIPFEPAPDVFGTKVKYVKHLGGLLVTNDANDLKKGDVITKVKTPQKTRNITGPGILNNVFTTENAATWAELTVKRGASNVSPDPKLYRPRPCAKLGITYCPAGTAETDWRIVTTAGKAAQLGLKVGDVITKVGQLDGSATLDEKAPKSFGDTDAAWTALLGSTYYKISYTRGADACSVQYSKTLGLTAEDQGHGEATVLHSVDPAAKSGFAINDLIKPSSGTVDLLMWANTFATSRSVDLQLKKPHGSYGSKKIEGIDIIIDDKANDDASHIAPGFRAPGFLDSRKDNNVQGYGDVLRYSMKANQVATWNFGDQPAGDYRISTTWERHKNRTRHAQYSINGVRSISGDINQEETPTRYDNKTQCHWEDLDPHYAHAGGELKVTVTHSENGRNDYLIADAVRIECPAP